MTRGYTDDDDRAFYAALGELTTGQIDMTLRAFREAQAIERQFREESEQYEDQD